MQQRATSRPRVPTSAHLADGAACRQRNGGRRRTAWVVHVRGDGMEVRWLSLGKSACEVGEILEISQRTVDWNADGAMRKLRTVNRTQTGLEALRRGLVSP